MDSKQAALATIVVVGGFGFLVVSCSDSDRHMVHHQTAEQEYHVIGALTPEHEPQHAAPAMHHESGEHGQKYTQPYTVTPSVPALCLSGKKQSPIDISEASIGAQPDIQFHYSAAPLQIVNSGYTMLVNYDNGSHAMVGDTKYELYQIDFHTPSEHTIGGKAYDMEAHLIHKSPDGADAVIAVFFEAGEAVNKTISKLWLNMPENEGDTINVHDVVINAADLLPAQRNYYRYEGSLTGGSCAEGVDWMVMATPNHIANAQLKQFTHTFSDNARSLQALNDREVYLSN